MLLMVDYIWVLARVGQKFHHVPEPVVTMAAILLPATREQCPSKLISTQ